mgnify:CR=1 FL=1
MSNVQGDTFSCTQCAGCCHESNLRQYNLEHWGLEVAEDGYCSNLKDNMCTIYDDRPLLCRVEELFDRYEELREVEPRLFNLVSQARGGDNAKLEYFKIANRGCNYLIKRLGLDDTYLIDIDAAYVTALERDRAEEGK